MPRVVPIGTRDSDLLELTLITVVVLTIEDECWKYKSIFVRAIMLRKLNFELNEICFDRIYGDFIADLQLNLV